MSNFHTPVLLKEVIEGLRIVRNGKYIDATIGGGGHTKAILDLGGRVLGIDQDQDAIDYVRTNNEEKIKNNELKLVNGNFSDIKKIAEENGFKNADGILFDLGVSSYQIDKSGRGFSFRRDEPLDMRMSKGIDITAYEIINTASQDELYNIFSRFGEERNARKIAELIVERRGKSRIETSKRLADIILEVISRTSDAHPATRIFQALRIFVNSEIDNLKKGLDDAFQILGPSGRLCVISFHSLEDRQVKLYFSKVTRVGRARLINKKPIVAGSTELAQNRRARSAKLRILEKI